MTHSELRNKVIDVCKSHIEERITFYLKMMNDEQKIANSYKGAMESRYDTFKEEAQARKDNMAKQADMFMSLNSHLQTISQNDAEDKVKYGAIVKLSNGFYYFFFANIFDDSIVFDDYDVTPISFNSPLGNALRDKKTGETITFSNKNLKIEEIF